MGRKKAPERKIGGFLEASMRKAVELVIGGMSLREASEREDVKVTTLFRYVVKQKRASPERVVSMCPKYDVRKVFTEAQEEMLKDYILRSATIFFGLTKKDTRILAYKMAKANGITVPKAWVRDQEAGEEWMRGFRSRHPEVVVRRPEACSLARLTSFNRSNVDVFFNKLEQIYSTYPSIASNPSRIFNLDETATTTVQKPKHVLAQRGTKTVGKATSGERGQLVTTVAICCAQGTFLPPAMVFPRKNLKDTMLRGAVPGTLGLANNTGWMKADMFPEVINHFVKYSHATKEDPVLLVLDNAEVHISLEAIDIARDNGVILLTLPPHCSHKLQPLDVSVLFAFKSFYNSALDSFMMRSQGRPATIYDVGELVGTAYTRGFTPSNITAGFRKTGIFPFDKDIFSDADYIGSAVTDRPDPNAATSTVGLDNASCAADADTETTDEMQLQANERPGPSGLSVSRRSNITPVEIQPYPKAPPRKNSRKGRLGKSRCLTDTPVRANVAEKDSIRKAKQARLLLRKNIPGKRLSFTKQTNKSRTTKRNTSQDSSSSEDEQCPDFIKNGVVNTSDEEGSTGDSSSASNTPRRTFTAVDTPPDPGSYVLVELSSDVFYVGHVLEPDESNDMLVSYLRKSAKVSNAFIFPNAQDVHTLVLSEVRDILPAPIPGKTPRLSRHVSFRYDFSNMDIR